MGGRPTQRASPRGLRQVAASSAASAAATLLCLALGAAAQGGNPNGDLGADLGIPLQLARPPLPPSPPPPPLVVDAPSGLSTGQIIGICFGAGLGAPLLVCLLVFVMARCLRRASKQPHSKKWINDDDPELAVSKHLPADISAIGDDIELGHASFRGGDIDAEGNSVMAVGADIETAGKPRGGMGHFRRWLDSLHAESDKQQLLDGASGPHGNHNRMLQMLDSALVGLQGQRQLEGVNFSRLAPSVMGSPAPSSITGSSRLLLNCRMRSDMDAEADAEAVFDGVHTVEGAALSTPRTAHAAMERGGGVSFSAMPQDSLGAAVLMSAALEGGDVLLVPPGGGVHHMAPQAHQGHQYLTSGFGSPSRARNPQPLAVGSPVQVHSAYTGEEDSPSMYSSTHNGSKDGSIGLNFPTPNFELMEQMRAQRRTASTIREEDSWSGSTKTGL